MSVFSFGFGPPEPLTPEQRAELEKQRLAHLSDVERKYHSILSAPPRRAIREAAAHGCGGSRFESCRETLALLIDDMETALVRPPP